MHAVTFQRGFAGWIEETHLNNGLKLLACSDALIATAGDFPPLLFHGNDLAGGTGCQSLAETH